MPGAVSRDSGGRVAIHRDRVARWQGKGRDTGGAVSRDSGGRVAIQGEQCRETAGGGSRYTGVQGREMTEGVSRDSEWSVAT